MKCEEVKDKLETGARQKVEEAMTAARLRTCPKPSCKKKFYKVEGMCDSCPLAGISFFYANLPCHLTQELTLSFDDLFFIYLRL